MQHPPESVPADEKWRELLTVPFPHRRARRIRSRIPSAPRCKLCAAPFEGIGGALMSRIGHARWAKNPKYCAGCFGMLSANHGGAEIDCSMLFADVRGSTALAEVMPPRAFNRLMGRFYDTAVRVLIEYDAFVDKFVGDEIIAVFVPAMAGDDHPLRAIEAAQALLRATGHDAADARPWVPVGAGVNSGTAYVGSIGEGADTELTAMGDVVNTTARLASAAAAGEILVTVACAERAGATDAGLERRSLELKGKQVSTDVVVMSVATRIAAR